MKSVYLFLLMLAPALSAFSQITGSGTINRIPKFTAAAQIGNSQIFDNGTNIGIGATAPGYKLDILHGGTNGIRIKSSAGLSAVDIEAANGEAHVRFLRTGALHWQMGNDYVDNSFLINETGLGVRFFIKDATGNVGIGTVSPTARLHVNGTITSTGAKAFTIDHPLDPENKMLRHFAIESNEVLNSYSGNVVTNEKSVATVTLPDYFEAVNKDFRYQLTVVGGFAQAVISREIEHNRFEIATSKPGVKVSWEVKALRNDMYMRQKPAPAVEELKPADMRGKYFDPEVYGQPEHRGVNYRKPAAEAPAGETSGALPGVITRATAAPGGKTGEKGTLQ